MTTIDVPSSAASSAASSSTLQVSPCSPTIGAEVSGVDLSLPLDAATIAAIRGALLDWKVLFFRDQPITTAQHLAFARHFGELEVHPFAPHHPDHPEVLAITHGPDSPGNENGWHSDVTWRRQPSLGSVLKMVDGPVCGGDTLFADMEAAYRGLPSDVRERVEGRTARHDFVRFRLGLERSGASADEIAEFNAAYPNPHHPVIRTHPETGRKSIYVNGGFTQEIDGLDADESAQLLQVLYAQAAVPEYQVRLEWEPGTIAFWDNRSVQHYACSDYWPQQRRVERVTIIGDTPYYDPTQPEVTQAADADGVGDDRFQGRIKRRRVQPNSTPAS